MYDYRDEEREWEEREREDRQAAIQREEQARDDSRQIICELPDDRRIREIREHLERQQQDEEVRQREEQAREQERRLATKQYRRARPQ